jgi:hypothetical protein
LTLESFWLALLGAVSVPLIATLLQKMLTASAPAPNRLRK